MKQFLLTVAGVFAALLLFFVGLPLLVIGVMSAGSTSPTPAKTVLALDLRGGLSDQDPSTPSFNLSGSPMSVTSIVLSLRRAETDPKVKGLYVRLPESGMEPAAAEELAQSFRRLKAAGKNILVHGQGLYASGVTTSTYALGAAASEYWMQPGSTFEATGVSIEDIFLKRAFDKYGVEPQFEQRGRYKNAVNPLLFDDYTPAHKEAQLSWMTALYDASLTSAARDRKIDPAALRTLIEAGPYDADAAQAKGLIDKVGLPEEAREAALEKAGDGELLDIVEYQPTASLGATGDAIAVVNVEGAIVTGTAEGVSPFGGESMAYSDDIATAIRDAIEEDHVKAIVLRVSSPGGSDTASEQIGAAVRAAKKAGKPVVVSMGTYAASGGYWISSDADAIIAHPSTLTGSIGVYGGKFAFGGLASRFGVDLRETNVGGEYASSGAIGHGFTPTQRAAYSAQIDRVYNNFVNHVARGRKLAPERVRQMAEGHVWTGAQAKTLGLVDDMGGLIEAIDKAKALSGIKGKARLILLPEPVSPLDALEQALGVSASGVRTLAAAAWVMGDPYAQQAMDQLSRARLRSQGANVLSPVYVPGASR